MRLPHAVSGLLLLAVALGGASPTGDGPTAWRWPLDPHVVARGYEAPATPYSAGHRGIDLGASPDRPVFAPADGVVSFAGVVVDRPVVTVSLPGGVLVSVEPVRSSVQAGQRVSAGDVLGVVGTDGHCAGHCLHLGVRLHGAYVSPMLFLGGIPRAVLLPLERPSRAGAQARG